MSSRASRILISVAAIVVGFYLVVIFAWAVRPLDDAVPVGADFSRPDKYPAGVLVSATVECRPLFETTGRTSKPLPTLAPQPKGHDPLAFQRETCTAVQRDARIVFGLDTVLVLAVLGGIGFAFVRQRRVVAVAVP